jgi:hypothetical protein
MPTSEELRERERDVQHQREKMERQIARRDERLKELHAEQEEARKRRKALAQREQELEHAIEEAREHELWTKRACLDHCTTWLGLKLLVTTVAAKTDWDGGLVAADRTSHADDCGDKMSQAELWEAFQQGVGNPANPPGTSSHEGINGGSGGTPVTDRFPAGANLPHFMWGIDVGGDGNAFKAGATRLGFDVRQHPGEAWHFNVMTDPSSALKRLDAV